MDADPNHPRPGSHLFPLVAYFFLQDLDGFGTTRDLSVKRPPKAIVSTDPTQSAEQIISDVMTHWSLNVTVEEGRAHMGMETQCQWSDLALERSTPLPFGLSILVTLFGQAGTLIAAFLSLKPPGIVSRRLPSVMFLLPSDDRWGARGRFPDHPRILMWFSSRALLLNAGL